MAGQVPGKMEACLEIEQREIALIRIVPESPELFGINAFNPEACAARRSVMICRRLVLGLAVKSSCGIHGPRLHSDSQPMCFFACRFPKFAKSPIS
jgi:hypothetical protein